MFYCSLIVVDFTLVQHYSMLSAPFTAQNDLSRADVLLITQSLPATSVHSHSFTVRSLLDKCFTLCLILCFKYSCTSEIIYKKLLKTPTQNHYSNISHIHIYMYMSTC